MLEADRCDDLSTENRKINILLGFVVLLEIDDAQIYNFENSVGDQNFSDVVRFIFCFKELQNVSCR